MLKPVSVAIPVGLAASLACGGPACAAPSCPKPDAVFDGAGRRGDVIPPRVIQLPLAPPYPATLRDRAEHGVVFADYVVSLAGQACLVRVTSVDGKQDFADTTTHWLATAAFTPATRAGKPIIGEVKRVLRLGRQPDAVLPKPQDGP